MVSWRSTGDAPLHASGVSKTERETAERGAAERIVGLLPTDQAAQFRGMWLEFEAGRSAEARFANALDRLQSRPLNILAPAARKSKASDPSSAHAQ